LGGSGQRTRARTA